MTSKLNYEENFSNGQWNPLDTDFDDMEILLEFERGEGFDVSQDD